MLYPHHRLRDPNEPWKGSLARYLTPMKKTLRALYDSEYKIIPVERQEEIEKDTFDTYMDNCPPRHLTHIGNTRKDRGFEET
jgi:hypothetical protein